MLTHERLCELLSYDPDTGVFIWKKCFWRPALIGSPAGNKIKSGYLQIHIDGQRYYAHCLAWFYSYKAWPCDLTDHIDGDKSNNRLSNLRAATYAENSWNSKLAISNTSGLKGATFHARKGRWTSGIQVNGQRIWLGHFATKELAHAAYAAAAAKYHGKFANRGMR